MKSAIVAKFSKWKLAVLAISFIVAAIAWFAAYEYFKSGATSYQLNRPIDIKNNSGLTRLKIYIDSTSVSGVAFCASAATLLLIDRLRKAKK